MKEGLLGGFEEERGLVWMKEEFIGRFEED
jgi:hypothetical protein